MIDKREAGFAFEDEVAEKLKGQGYTHVKVTKRSRDYGGDIIAHKNGLEYVIQCKKYKGKVGYSAVKDISTAMEIYQADRGMIVCDTDYSVDARKAVARIDKPIELIGDEYLKTWKIYREEKHIYRPFKHQKRILDKLARHKERGKQSALIVMATGLGKTLIAAWDLKNQMKKGEKALFLVHRKDILVENAEKFYEVLNEKKENFKFGVYYGGKRFRNEDVVFSTYQTIRTYHRKIPRNYFKYIIVDEAHHAPAASYSNILSYFEPKFILGITATPKRIAKSDNEFMTEVFGPPVINIDLPEALVRNYLTSVRYSIFCDNIDYDRLKSANRKLSIEQLNRNYFIPTKDEDIENIIQKEINNISKPRVIIFCPNIKYINSVKSMGMFKGAEVYHSNMSDFERFLIFRRFKIGLIKTLLVVDLFNEGIDIPDANLLVFLRTTYSPTIFFQQLGRGLRKHKNKKYLRVLDFVGALSNIKKQINMFGHLLIIQDFVEKVDDKGKAGNIIYRSNLQKSTGLLEPLELTFFQYGKLVKHRERVIRRKDFLSEMEYLKRHLRKCDGWTEEEVVNDLRLICEKINQFPTQKYLQQIKRQDLIGQVARMGGAYHFAKLLGYEMEAKPGGYWDNRDNLKKEVLPFCKKYGRMPTPDELKQYDRLDLAAAISQKTTYADLAKELGFETKTRKKGHWEKWANVKKELLPLCRKYGKMPTKEQLEKLGKSDLIAGIYYNWGDLNKVAEKLGFKTSQKPGGHWDNWDNFEVEISPICKRIGKVPSWEYLRNMGRGDLAAALQRWGSHYVARKLGFETSHKPEGYWNEWKNVVKALTPIIRKKHKFPSLSYLRRSGMNALSSAISGKWGGLYAVANKMGYDLKVKSPNYWKSWANVRSELIRIRKKEQTLPTPQYLLDTGRNGLCSAVYKYYGGFKVVFKKLGYSTALGHKPI